MKLSIYSEDRIPGGNSETEPFMAVRNSVVLSTLSCGTHIEEKMMKVKKKS